MRTLVAEAPQASETENKALADPIGPIAQQHLDSGGKRLRARLALWAAELLGAAPKDAVAWAAACELVHNATLIHDDLQDGDTKRRGQPTTWVAHGLAQAINAGDLLLVLPTLALRALKPAVHSTLLLALAETVVQVIRGQAREFSLICQEKLDWPSYRSAVQGKTAALFALPVEGAALLAGKSGAAAKAMAAPFGRLGLVFQLQDDVLDLYGDKGRGQRGCDLYEGKISALVVEHLSRCPSERFWWLELLRAPRAQTSEVQVREAIRRIQDSGALASVLEALEAEAAAALVAVRSAAPQLAGLFRDVAQNGLRAHRPR